jgi:hypothetical protein
VPVLSADEPSAAEQAGPPQGVLRWLLAAGGAIGFLAAFVLTVELT